MCRHMDGAGNCVETISSNYLSDLSAGVCSFLCYANASVPGTRTGGFYSMHIHSMKGPPL